MAAATLKLTWKVDPPPTGRYRSFQKRGWPTAYYPNGKPAAFIRCADAYRPADVALGEHAPLTVVLCHHQHPKRENSWVLLRHKTSQETLAAAKATVLDFLTRHPEYHPTTEEQR